MECLHFLLLLFFFQSHLLSCMSQVGAQSANTEREALLSFKLKIIDPQNAISGWTQNSSHCTWYGVSCSVNGTQVQSLNLTGLGLIGILPPQLSNLTSLRILDLSKNSFYGPIPLEFDRLSLLEQMILAQNNINGTIPVVLSNCFNLKVLSLPRNQLTGNLPPELGHLQRLEILDFSLNNLSGVIPPKFGNLSSLTSISLARNQFNGEIPGELGRLLNLQHIQLSENYFIGEIPYSIFNLSSLVYISLTQNNLTGKLPTEMGHAIPNLSHLFLARNRLEGMIPKSISNASNIQSLELSWNNLQGPIPYLGNMKKLSILNLGQNNLSSTTEQNFQLIDSLKNCTQLEILMIFSNKLAGNFPSSVANLSIHLQHFCIGDNLLTGSFPQGIERFRNLISLSIEQNSFTGEVPKSIGTLTKLQSILAYENMLSGEIPDIFGNFKQLYALELGNNQFSGRIPASIRDCQQLSLLYLSGNRLSGSIPKEIFVLSGLRQLGLAQNALHGSLPTEVGNLKQLEVLIVSDNQLSGNLPASISGCSSLQNLNMARNNITGSIPSTIGNLLSLVSLDFSSNSLSGAIPKDLGNLEYLQSLNLSFNLLEGEVPTKGVFVNLSRDSLHGNSGLCSRNQDIAGKLGLSQCVTEKRKKHFLLKLIVAVVGGTLLINVIICFLWALISKKKKNKKGKGNSSSPPIKVVPPMISYSEIQLATDNFAAQNLIGKGAFGSVYKGVFKTDENGASTSNTTLAVKVLDLQQHKAAQSFDAECEALRNVRHRNLVKIITSCSSIDHGGAEFKALVMEFMPNGNLDKWLYPEDPKSGFSLSLLQRLNIAIDIAFAMDYLHHDCDPPVVHCDLKPGNVLLDDDMVAHVGDFGLARFRPQNPSQSGDSTIGLKGSIGYIAPEYGLGGKASTSGDVYSYGILLLEMFLAKKPTDKMFKEGLNLNKFASAVDESHVMQIADSRLFENDESSTQSTSSSNFNGGPSTNSNSNSNNRYWLNKVEECVTAVIRVGLSCAVDSAQDRLTMRETLTKLLEIKKFLLQL